MPSETTERFMTALQQAEDGGDLGPLVALFHEDAELTNLANDEPRRGRDGARRFWDEYLQAFDQIRSTFGHVFDDGQSAALGMGFGGNTPRWPPLELSRNQRP